MSKPLIALCTVTYSKDNVLVKVHSQSNASNKDLGIPAQKYVDGNGEEKEGFQTLRLAQSGFKCQPFQRDFVAIEVDRDNIYPAEGGQMMQCASFKVLAIGAEAKKYAGAAHTPSSAVAEEDVPFK